LIGVFFNTFTPIIRTHKPLNEIYKHVSNIVQDCNI